MHVGREYDLVRFDKEPGCLQTDDQVFARDDFCGSFAHLSAMAHSPGVDLPGGEILRHGKIDLGDSFGVGLQRGHPEGRVGEVLADSGFDQIWGIG